MQEPKSEVTALDTESARTSLISGLTSAPTPRQASGLFHLGRPLLGCIVVSLTLLASTGKTDADRDHHVIKRYIPSSNHIVEQLESIGGWDVNLHIFQDITPHGTKTFTNIIATHNPNVERRLTLACHYDSKYFNMFNFIGATDAALPCAQLLYLARSLAEPLRQASNPPVTLQLIFFDGHESFIRWSDRDSLYGSRQLAGEYIDRTSIGTLLDGMDILVLLNRLGSKNSNFINFFYDTSVWYNHMIDIEQRLKRNKLWYGNDNYFQDNAHFNVDIQDDHIPFRNTIRTLLLATYPFPEVWHTEGDNAAALDDDTISNLSKMFHVFVIEYLGLSVLQ
ncbi:glutaminyl-peptide cyclotransferase-like [Lytechinus pictus]|uniref:glutaminyl-peptide cyclotransferase-like n=1 Tax=Lytechinus pictus TaxID=7653 RepID=UPI0030B9EB67